MANYLTFSSPSSFTLNTYNNAKYWDGTLEYSTDASTWNVWEGATLSSDNGKLYLRGTGNTKISYGTAWVISGSDVSCEGNIENLLDYTMVANGQHPAMAIECFKELFGGCTSLISAPALLATTLTDYCYHKMFKGCTNLISAPALPATTLATACYREMFWECSSLVSIPALPATTLVDSCYRLMFYKCSNVKISSTQTEEYCNEYRIPTNGEGATVSGAVTSMFTSTGGTFKSDPSINTTYYTANRVIYEDEEPEATSTVITYNGSTIATLEAGQTATIKTAETEVEHDIIITPVFPIEIAYGDIIATANEGQTATIKCANTEADFDIVVSAKAEEVISDLTGTTWLFNSNIDRDKPAVGYGIKGTATSGEYTFEVQSLKIGERSGSSNYFTIEYAPVGSNYGAFFRQWGNWEYYDGSNWYNISTPPTLTITGGADATNADLIAWLEANATKQ